MSNPKLSRAMELAESEQSTRHWGGTSMALLRDLGLHKQKQKQTALANSSKQIRDTGYDV